MIVKSFKIWSFILFVRGINQATKQQSKDHFVVIIWGRRLWSLISCVQADQTSNTRTINKPTSTLQIHVCICIQYVG